MSTKATILVGLAAALIGLGLLVGLPWLAGVPFRRPDIEGFFMIIGVGTVAVGVVKLIDIICGRRS